LLNLLRCAAALPLTLFALAVTAPALAASATTQQTVNFTYFTALAPHPGNTGTVSAYASSGLPVALTVTTPAVCTLTGSTYTLTAVGTCIIQGFQAGNSTFVAQYAYVGISATAGVAVPTPVIVPNLPPTLAVGDSVQANATVSANVGTGYSTYPAGVCALQNGNLVAQGVGICSVTIQENGDATNAAGYLYVTMPITASSAQQVQTISYNYSLNVMVGGTGYFAASSNSGLPLTLTSVTPTVCSISGTVVTGIAAGVCVISATQEGNAAYLPATNSGAITVIAQVGLAQSITLTLPPNIAVGNSGTGTAIASSGLTPTVYSTSPSICSVTGQIVNGPGTGNFSISGLAPGTCYIGTFQLGNATYAQTYAYGQVQIGAPSNFTTATLSAGANFVNVGQAVSLSCTVTGTPAPASPLTGTVQFLDNGAMFASAALNNGSASISQTWNTAGVHQLQCSYPGGGNYPAASSYNVRVQAGVNEGVECFVSSLTQTSGQPFLVTGIVYDNNSGAAAVFASATGTVTFYDGSNQIGTATVTGGKGSTLVTIASTGAHNLKAVYSGDANYPAGTSDITSIKVLAAVTVTLTSSQNPSPPGQNLALSANLAGGSSPTGTVTFFDNGVQIGAAQVGGNAQAVFTTSALPAGGHVITASYAGDQANGPATSAPFTQAIGNIVPQAGYWWNPAEPGRGFVIEIQGATMLVASFLYDASGRSTWVTSTGPMTSNTQYSGALLTYNGGQTLTGSYKSPNVAPSLGTISITFTSNNQGTLTWPGGTIPIRRFDIVPGGASSTQPSGNPQTGWWLNPNEGGRGFAIEVQNGQMYFAGYMYDTSGNPVWYLAAGTLGGGNGFQGVWQQYGNGQTLTGTYQSPSVVTANAGNVTLQFSDTATATLTLPDGRQIPLVRYQFSTPATITHTGLTPLTKMAGAGDWTTYQGNNAHTGYVPVTLNPSVFGLRWSWVQPLGGPAVPGSELVSMVVTGNDQLYVTSLAPSPGTFGAERLYALKEFDASQVWMQEINKSTGGVIGIGAPTFASGKVFFIGAPPGTIGTSLQWFSAADGTSATAPVGGNFYAFYPPLVVGNLVFAQDNYYGGVNAHDITTGKPVYQTNYVTYPGTNVWLPASDGTNLYIYSQTNFSQAGLATVNAQTGIAKPVIADSKWAFQTGVGDKFNVPVFAASGSVFTNNAGQYMTRYDTNAGTLVWRFTEYFVNNPAYSSGVLYIESAGFNRLEAHAEADGAMLWSWSPPTAFDNSFVGDVLLTNNLVFVSTNYAVYAIDVNTHQTAWSYPRAGHLALSANGVLYVVTVDNSGKSDGNIFAINVQ
jgi:hypothetical protein